MLSTPNWRDWYRLHHRERCFQSGTAFEQYATTVLARFHDDFVNPSPAGALGDGGCDGLAESGTVLYACYGQRPGRQAEREVTAKIESDFARGAACWPSFTTWRFVTNAPVGPLALGAFTDLQLAHGPGSMRPLEMRIWNPDTLWAEIVGSLPPAVLDDLFPGAPGVVNLELADVLPLLDALGEGDLGGEDTGAEILPVPVDKMDHNDLPPVTRFEFNAGRLMAPRVDRWYNESSEPGLYDAHGERFRALYAETRAVTRVPSEIVERLYVAVAGPNFRIDGRRANAAYAVVSYFFDSCHIFEAPGDAHAATD